MSVVGIRSVLWGLSRVGPLLQPSAPLAPWSSGARRQAVGRDEPIDAPLDVRRLGAASARGHGRSQDETGAVSHLGICSRPRGRVAGKRPCRPSRRRAPPPVLDAGADHHEDARATH